MATDARELEFGADVPSLRLPKAAPGTALYVHLPFCAAKCHYCDFYSVAAAGHDVDGLIERLLDEAARFAPARPRTVFLGGGTPSLLSVAQLRRVLDELDRLTDFRAFASEVTAECNPESLDYDKVRALLELGVTRLSLGFQSLDDATLALFGRVHSVDDSFRAFEAARRAGCARINIDMIFAAPGQSTQQWRADLQRVLALGPEHLSAYNLTFEEETPFRRWRDQGRLAQAPEELELELFELSRALLLEHGYAAYEVSNFALDGQQCAHNVNYWRNGEYLGIGPSAVSKTQLVRAGNVRALHDYKQRIARAGEARTWAERPGPLTRLAETWWLGLRLSEGLHPQAALERAAVSLDEFAGVDPTVEVVARMVDLGLLERIGATVRLTPRGLPVADAIAKEFLALARSESDGAEATRFVAVAP